MKITAEGVPTAVSPSEKCAFVYTRSCLWSSSPKSVSVTLTEYPILRVLFIVTRLLKVGVKFRYSSFVRNKQYGSFALGKLTRRNVVDVLPKKSRVLF